MDTQKTENTQTTNNTANADGTKDIPTPRESAILEAFKASDESVTRKVPVPTETQKTENTDSKKGDDSTVKLRQQAIEMARMSRKMRELTEAVNKREQSIAEFERIKEKLRDTNADPGEQAEILRRLGLDLTEYTDRTLKRGVKPKTPEEIKLSEIEKKIADRELKEKELAGKEAERQQSEKIKYEMAVTRDRVKAAAGTYPLLSAMEQSHLIVNEAYRRERAGELTPDDTFESIAEYTENQLRTGLRQSLKTLKAAGLLDSILSELGDAKDEKDTKEPPARKASTTLSNSNQTQAKKQIDRSKLTDYERKRLAVAEAFEVSLDE
jgi:hypothetical protein